MDQKKYMQEFEEFGTSHQMWKPFGGILRQMMDDKIITAFGMVLGPKWAIFVSDCKNTEVVANATKRLNEFGFPERFYTITDMKTTFGGEICVIDQ
jgi:hypothetical protein